MMRVKMKLRIILKPVSTYMKRQRRLKNLSRRRKSNKVKTIIKITKMTPVMRS